MTALVTFRRRSLLIAAAATPTLVQHRVLAAGQGAAPAIVPSSTAPSATLACAYSDALLMQGVAGAVSITISLIILVALFQKQIVSGLTQGAVKG